jgi:hypothetical protein
MDRTTGQQWPRLQQRQILQAAHPLDPLCGLMASSMGQFFVRGCGGRGSVTIHELIRLLINNLQTRFVTLSDDRRPGALTPGRLSIKEVMR